MSHVLVLLIAATPIKVAALAPITVGLEPGLADAWVERFATQLAVGGNLSVISARGIAQVLGLERQKQLLGCSDSSCAAELAAALGVDALVMTSFSRSPKSITTTVRVLNAATGAVIVEDTHRGSDTDATQDWLDGIVATFVQRLRQELRGAPAETIAAGTPASSRAIWVAGAISLALAAGSAVAFGLSAADAARLQSTEPLPLDQIDQLEHSGQIERWVGVGLLAGAGVGVATALVLLLTGSSSRVAFLVSPGSHGGFAQLQGVW